MKKEQNGFSILPVLFLFAYFSIWLCYFHPKYNLASKVISANKNELKKKEEEKQTISSIIEQFSTCKNLSCLNLESPVSTFLELKPLIQTHPEIAIISSTATSQFFTLSLANTLYPNWTALDSISETTAPCLEFTDKTKNFSLERTCYFNDLALTASIKILNNAGFSTLSISNQLAKNYPIIIIAFGFVKIENLTLKKDTRLEIIAIGDLEIEEINYSTNNSLLLYSALGKLILPKKTLEQPPKELLLSTFGYQGIYQSDNERISYAPLINEEIKFSPYWTTKKLLGVSY